MDASFLATHARPHPTLQAPVVAPPNAASASPHTGSSATKSFNTREPASNVSKKCSDGKGWTDLVNTVRTCAGASYTNVLKHDWPWKRRRTCRAGGVAQKIKIVSCASCLGPVPGRAVTARSGKPIRCPSCCIPNLPAQRNGLEQRPPLTTMGPPPPKQPSHLKRIVPPPGPAIQYRHESILEEAAAVVHPDHLHVLQLPNPGSHLARSRSCPDHVWINLALRPPCIGGPHYEPNGEILAVLPGAVRRFDGENHAHGRQPARANVVAELFVPPQSGRTPAESIVISDSSDPPSREPVHISQQQPPLNALAFVQVMPKRSRSSSTTHPEGSSLVRTASPGKSPSLETGGSQQTSPQRDDDGHPSKRKRTLHSFVPIRPVERICTSSGCGQQIPPNAKDEFCSDCGFILWRKQFHARVAGISASVTTEPDPSEKASKASQDSSAVAGGSAGPSNGLALALVVARKRPAVTEDKPTSSPVSTKVERSPIGTEDHVSSGLPVSETISRHLSPSPTIPAPTAPEGSPQSVLTPDIPKHKEAELQPVSSSQQSSGPPVALQQSDIPREAEPPATSTLEAPAATSTSQVSEKPEGSTAQPDPSASLPSPPPTARPSLKIRIKISKHLRKRKKSSLERQLMWDSDMSDLTPLEDSTDEGESEVDTEQRFGTAPRMQTQGKDGAPLSPPPTPNPVKHRGICATVGCANFMPEGSRLRTCTKCRSTDRKAKRHLKRRMLMAQIHDDADEIQPPPDGDLTGYRKCLREWCEQMIPPETEYRYKKCPSCLRQLRNRARDMRADATSPQSEDDEDGNAPLRRASRAKIKQPQFPLDDRRLPDVMPDVRSAALLSAFHNRFGEFTVAQAHYLRFKTQQGGGALGGSRRNRHPIVFRFDGEYSIVADPSGGVVDVVVQLSDYTLPPLHSPVGVNAGPEISVVTVLRCVYAAQFPLLNSPPSTSTLSASATPAPEAEVQPREASERTFQVKMVGELQVCVA
ncbi:hypothetical protein BD414DRAFT_540777 [Trametes punicea]|nr:hypothetical protein BD414DRAFT_540777 [Trametes punicea]